MQVTGSHGVQVGDHSTQTNLAVPVGEALPAPATVGAPPGTHNLPLPSGVFVGRDLGVLDGLLDRGGAVVGQAVHGLGGIGKTELAIQYAHAHLGRYRLVWWITAETGEQVSLGLAELTRRLHPIAGLAQAEPWAIGWLQTHPGWLLVLDNVEDPAHITTLLGHLHGCGTVLVTTRRDLGSAGWARLGLVPVRLDVLARADSVALLLTLTGRQDHAGADRLAAELGDLPLALEQAGGYLSHNDGCSIDGYRRLLVEHFERMSATPGAVGDPDRTVRRVWQLTMAAIAARSPLAVRVLSVLGYLSGDGLAEDVLTPLADEPLDVVDALSLLASYNMINRSGGMVGVHRLVQAITRSSERASEPGVVGQPTPLEWAVELLVAAAPDDPWTNVAGWPRWNALLAHIDAVAAHLPQDHHNTRMSYLLDRAATYLQGQGQLSRAIALFERAVIDAERVLGDGHPNTLASRHNLAYAYQDAGRLTEAITLHQAVLTDTQRILGNDHPNTLTSRHNLAYAYRAAGRLTQAITLHQAVLTDRQRILGNDHPHTLISRHNLASAYQAAGRLTQAITLHQTVLTDRQRILGNDHPHTLISRHNLAGAYRAAGRLTEAITLYQTVLTDTQRILGNDHPLTMTVTANLRAAWSQQVKKAH